MENNKNTYLAIGLSILVIVAWQYFYVSPRVESQKRAAEIEAQRQLEQKVSNPEIKTEKGVPTTSSKSGLPTDVNVPGSLQSQISGKLKREDAIEGTKRIKVETESLTGSINLTGARVDDLRLKKYRETIDPESPLIELLSPNGTQNAYFAEFGFAGEDQVGGVPGPDTQWMLESRGTIGDGDAATVTDKNDRTQQQTRLAAAQPSFDFTVESKKIVVKYQNLRQVRVNYYLMDVELLFSQNPFVKKYSGQFSHIRPNQTQKV